MASLFWDRQSVAFVNFVPRGHPVNADYYCLLLSDDLIDYNQKFAKSDVVCCRKMSFFNMIMYCGGLQLPTKDTTIRRGIRGKGRFTQSMPFRPFNPRAGVNH